MVERFRCGCRLEDLGIGADNLAQNVADGLANELVIVDDEDVH